MSDDNWYSLRENPPTEETAPYGFWVSRLGRIAPDQRWVAKNALDNGWIYWQPIVGPVGYPEKLRPRLPDGWHWEGKRIVRHVTQTYMTAPEQQTTSTTTISYWVDDLGVIHCSDGGGIPKWVIKALEEDGQLQ